MYLLTVTCNRDFYQMLLQAESINKFLEPCTHYVIVNEHKADLEFWWRWLSPYYQKHRLVLLNRIDYNYGQLGIDYTNNSSSAGWIMQQLQKLLVSYHLNQDYLILDSKNFFIKPTSLNEWEHVLGNPTLMTIDTSKLNPYIDSFNYHSNILNTTRTTVYSIGTPFKIERKYITDCPYFTFYELGSILVQTGSYSISEFLFYSLLIPADHPSFSTERKFGPGCTMLWDPEANSDELFEEIKNSEKHKLVSLHRRLLSGADNEFFMAFNDMLSSLNFENKILPMPIESTMAGNHK